MNRTTVNQLFNHVGDQFLALDVTTPRLWQGDFNNVNVTARMILREDVAISFAEGKSLICLRLPMNYINNHNEMELLIDFFIQRGYHLVSSGYPTLGLFRQEVFLSNRQ